MEKDVPISNSVVATTSVVSACGAAAADEMFVHDPWARNKPVKCKIQVEGKAVPVPQNMVEKAAAAKHVRFLGREEEDERELPI